MPEQMLKLLLSMVSHSDIIIWPLQTIHDLVWFQGHSNYERLHRRGVQKPAEIISDMMKTYEWRNTHIVELVEKNKNPKINIGQIIATVHSDTCLSYTSFKIGDTPPNLPYFLKQLKEETESPVIFVVGTVGRDFKEDAVENGVNNKNWIMFSDYTEKSENEYISIKNSGDTMYSGSLVFHDDRCAPGKKMVDCLKETAHIRETVSRLKRNKVVPVRFLSIVRWKITGDYQKIEYLQFFNGTFYDKLKYTDTFLATAKENSKCKRCLHCQEVCPDDTAIRNVAPGKIILMIGKTSRLPKKCF